MIRATTNGVLRGYRTNLNNSFITLNKARDTVLSQRLFNSYAEDPAAAAKAFRLRRARMAVESQYDITNSTYRKYQVAWSSLDGVEKSIDTNITGIQDAALRVLNHPTGDARETLSKTLAQMADTIIQDMNQTYGDNFVFAGADGMNVPFEVRTLEDGKEHVFYRGIDVNTEVPDCIMPEGGTAPDDFIRVTKDANGNITYDPAGGSYLKTRGTSVISAADYQKAVDAAKVPDVEKDANDKPVEYNADGTKYVFGIDVPDERGTGGYYLKAGEDPTDPQNLIPTSEYDAAVERQQKLPNLLSDGTDHQLFGADGTPKNPPAGDGDYYIVLSDDADTIKEEEYEQAKTDLERLNYLKDEKYFVDIGLGFKEDENGKLIESSAFNAALNGLTFLGYGVDQDGDPKNIVAIVKRMSELTEEAGTKGKFDYAQFDRLTGKLQAASAKLKIEYSSMDAESGKLKTNMELLEGNHDTLQEEYAELEDVDMADSITSFVWAQYCYNAALKVGNSILSQSLIDYMS